MSRRTLFMLLSSYRVTCFAFEIQVIVSLGAGPWDQLFGGGNSPALLVAAISAFASRLIAILAIPITRVEKSRIHH